MKCYEDRPNDKMLPPALIVAGISGCKQGGIRGGERECEALEIWGRSDVVERVRQLDELAKRPRSACVVRRRPMGSIEMCAKKAFVVLGDPESREVLCSII